MQSKLPLGLVIQAMALDIDQKDGGLSVVNFGAQVSCLLRMQGRYKGVEGGTEMGNGGGKEGDRGGGRGNEWGGREGWGRGAGHFNMCAETINP